MFRQPASDSLEACNSTSPGTLSLQKIPEKIVCFSRAQQCSSPKSPRKYLPASKGSLCVLDARCWLQGAGGLCLYRLCCRHAGQVHSDCWHHVCVTVSLSQSLQGHARGHCGSHCRWYPVHSGASSSSHHVAQCTSDAAAPAMRLVCWASCVLSAACSHNCTPQQGGFLRPALHPTLCPCAPQGEIQKLSAVLPHACICCRVPAHRCVGMSRRLPALAMALSPVLSLC